jgi:hypothetical protein
MRVVPLTVFDTKGNPTTRREPIEAAVEAAGRDLAGTPRGMDSRRSVPRGGSKVLITGPHGLERTAVFVTDDEPAVISERIRETLVD